MVVHTTGSGATPASVGEAGVVVVPEPPPAPELEEPALALPDDAVPVPPAEPLPEQLPMTEGWQAKPSPQSASALHGSCQG